MVVLSPKDNLAHANKVDLRVITRGKCKASSRQLKKSSFDLQLHTAQLMHTLHAAIFPRKKISTHASAKCQQYWNFLCCPVYSPCFSGVIAVLFTCRQSQETGKHSERSNGIVKSISRSVEINCYNNQLRKYNLLKIEVSIWHKLFSI